MDAFALSAEDLSCPICMERLRDPFVTPCGHSFCYTCIGTHLQHRSVCPCCAAYLTIDSVFPNHLLSKARIHTLHSGTTQLLLAVTLKAASADAVRRGSLLEQLQAAINADEPGLKLSDLDALLHTLEAKRVEMRQREQESTLELLLHFLNHSRASKSKKLQELQEELHILDKDIQQVETHQAGIPPASFLSLPGIEHFSQLRRSNDRLLGSGSMRAGSTQLLLGASPNMHAQTLDDTQTSSLPAAAAAAVGREGVAVPTARVSEVLPEDPMENPAESPTGPSLSVARSRPSLAASSLFHSNGRHLSANVLALDLLSSRIQEPGILASQPADSLAPGDSWEGGRMEPLDASLLPPADNAVLLRGQNPSLSSEARQPSSSVEPSSSTPPVPGPSTIGLTMPPPLPPASPERPGSSRDAQLSHRPSVANRASRLAGRAAPGGGPPSDPSSERTSAGTSSKTLSTSDAVEGSDARARKRRFESQFEDLQQHYLRMRQRQLVGAKRSASEGFSQPKRASSSVAAAAARPSQQLLGSARLLLENPSHTNHPAQLAKQAAAALQSSSSLRQDASGAAVGPIETDDLKEFSRMLAMFTQSTKLKVLAAIPGASQRASAAIISSIAFDKDARVFGTAGVSKRISLFNYQDVLESAAASNDGQASRPPLLELVSRSKLSCLAWNGSLGPQLASSDYEGVVCLWDAAAGQAVTEYEAHDKRIWSIDFCPADPHCLASGSDDCSVKVWSTTQPSSVAVIDMKANVCCVSYNPEKRHELAVGCADHLVHLYDLRRAAAPFHSFAGHRKAVSYVRYFSARELVSASTDSTLRLWSSRDLEQARAYSGHLNEKNFVGLSLSENFIACGSETSELFVYYRSMSKPVARKLFSPPPVPPPRAAGEAAAASRPNLQFISSVAWKPASQAILVANSQGAIKVMQLAA